MTRIPFALACRAALAGTLLLVAGCAAVAPVPDYAAIVNDPRRSEADRKNDARRQPVKLLEFYGVRPGMRVLDVGATSGYNTELLSRAVGPSGTVYAQNSPYTLENFEKGRLRERISKAGLTNVQPITREFDDPAPVGVHDLDLVTLDFNYHDTLWMGTDRARMNRAIFNALKPGGVYIIADHSAKPGADVSVGKSLHRIDENLVRREVEAAGFKLTATADFLRNPADTRDVIVFKNPVRNDEFVLKFVKPR